MGKLINRAMGILIHNTDIEAAEYLHECGYLIQDVFLAIKAALCILEYNGPPRKE